MYFDLDALGYGESYRLLVNTVVPRPIALVTTVDEDGVTNAAPFSFFNIMGHDPPILVLGIERRAPGEYKDTLANLRHGGEFIVNLVSEQIAGPMNICAVSFPREVDELARAGLSSQPGERVRVPRILEAPASLECTVRQLIALGEDRSLVIGNIHAMHLRDEFWDAERRYVRTAEMKLIARMHGRGWYARTSDLFHMARKTVDEFDQARPPGARRDD